MTLKLYIQPKNIIFAGRINEPSGVTYPTAQFQYDGVTTGTYSVVNLNQTVLIGSSAGAWDLGITRVRKFPDSDTMYIGRSSKGIHPGEVTLTDNAYFSVLGGMPQVFPKIPFIDSEGITYYDHDLDWATFGQYTPPVANAGSAVIGDYDGDILEVNFSASNSFVTMPGASIASYTWNLGPSGAGFVSPSVNSDENITAEFEPGFYVVTLLVADDNAQSHRCYVPVLSVDPDNSPFIENFEIVSHRITQSGQEMQVRVFDDIDIDTYLPGAWCAVVDGNPSDADDRSNVVFQGWIQYSDEEINATPTGTLKGVTLTLLDVAGRLKTLPGFSTVIEHAASPDNWQEFNTPRADIFLHHLAQWQSTALDVADFSFSGDEDDYTFKVLASDGATLYDQVNRRAQSLIPDHMLTCDRFGKLAIKIDPLLQDTGDRTSTTQTTLTPGSYADIRYRQQRQPRVGWLRSNAILIGTSSVQAAFCIAPGTAPGIGEADITDGENLALSQDSLNAVTGHRYARLNAPQGLFTITLADSSIEQTLDPADLTWLKVTIDAATAAQRGLTFTEARFLMRQIDIRYRHEIGGLVKEVTITAERETIDGVPATTETVPEAEEVDDGGWTPTPGGNQTHFNNGLDGGGTVAVIEANGYIYTTDNFTADPPTWSRNTAAATAVGFSGEVLRSWVVNPFSPLYRGTGSEVNGWVHHSTGIYKLNDIFGTPSYTLVKSLSPSTNSVNGRYAVIAASFGRYFTEESDNPWLLSVRSHRNTSGLNGVYCSYSIDGGQTWSTEAAISTNYDSQLSNYPIRIPGVYMSPRTPGYALVGVYTSTANPATVDIYKTEDWGATWAPSGITADLGNQLGYCFHVPWHDNSDESLLYYTKLVKSSVLTYATRRTNAGTDEDISPVDNSLHYAPFRPLFGIQSLDTNRLQMVMAGTANESDATDIGGSGSDSLGAIFVSSDGGDTWTKRYGPIAGGGNDDWASGVAFASGDSDIIYAWGEDGMVLYSADNGANWADKRPDETPGEIGGWTATYEILGIAGGGS